MISIVIAEDQSLLRGALAALLTLEPDIELLAQAQDGEEAVRLGLADFLTEGSAADAAHDYATKLATLPEHAVAATKRLCAPAAGDNSQVLDLMANQMFHESCKHEVAKASYARFGVKI